MKRSLSLAGGLLTSGLMLGAGTAHAHIDMLGALKSRGGDEKQVPCDGSRGANVYTFEPGAIITLGVTEAIAHDSYFRIAFDNDGQDGFKEPASIDPINKMRVSQGGLGTPRQDNPGCMTDTADKCGKPDFCNVVSTTGATVLWDNIDPHLAGESADTYTWTIQLPNVECENCTIQVLQIMEDVASIFHGPFDGDADIYHRCIDIKLKKGAGTTGPGNAAGGTVKVGTPGSKYPDPNKNCLAGMMTAGDAGVPVADAGTPVDAGRDTGTVTTTGGAGGTTGAAGAAGGATPGGTVGTPGGSAVGGVAGGTSGAGSTVGGSSPAPDAGAVASAGGTTTTTGGAVTTGNPSAVSNDDDGGCSVGIGSERASTAGTSLSLLGMMFVVRRMRRRKA